MNCSFVDDSSNDSGFLDGSPQAVKAFRNSKELYDFGRQIGSGGFAKAFRVINLKTKLTSVVKKISIKEGEKISTFSAFEREVAIHKQLKHKNVIEYYDSLFEEDCCFIELELADAGDLFGLLSETVFLGRYLDVDAYFKQLLVAVSYLHSIGVSHRDIKEENCFLSKIPSKVLALKLGDFGSAIRFRSSGGIDCKLTGYSGTEQYTAPEMCLDQTYDGDKIDIWSCGIVYVSMLSGRLLWDQAVSRDPAFAAFASGDLSAKAFMFLSDDKMAFVKQMLSIDPVLRSDACELLKVLDNHC